MRWRAFPMRQISGGDYSTPMTITRIDATRIAQVEQFWQRSRHLYQNVSQEDLPALLTNQIVLLGEEAGRIWGLLALQSEKRPATLPATAPTRAYIRTVALAQGSALTTAVPQLMAAAEAYLPAYAPAHLITIYGEQSWLNRALYHAGFTIAEEVQFFALAHVQRWQPPQQVTERAAQIERRALFVLRPCHPNDLAVLAELDAQSFTPLWHFGAEGLHELLFTSRFQVATLNDNLIGYTAMTYRGGSAHLARLAVHPQWQGQGFGHALLLDALLDAKRERVNTVMLNTQVHNRRAQQLYRSYGFRPTNQVIPVLAKLVGTNMGQDLHSLIVGPVV